jgi:hypothetical protein
MHLKTYHAGEEQFPFRPEYAPVPPSEVIDGQSHIPVHSFLDFRVQNRQLQMLVKYEGIDEPSWENAGMLKEDMPKYYAKLVKQLERATDKKLPSDELEPVKRRGRGRPPKQKR